MKYEIVINGTRRAVEFTPAPGNASRISLTVDGRRIEADAVRISQGTYSVLIGGRSIEATIEENSNGFLLRAAGREFLIEIFDPRSWRRRRGGGIEMEGRQQLVAPMPGKVVRVLCAVGHSVKAGQGLLVIEAMKMQNEIRAPKSGIVEKLAREGQTVNAGEVLAVVS
ncbi:MAG TPA: biotin/lipoyl-containing protein [Candidatus Acidoferrales bacterium]|nr:biotin/lipoyl-containing protein [Candidatus Acidoferrales bacterium]